MKENSPSLGERIRYFFDNTLGKGPMGLIIWLGLFISIVIIVISIIVTTTGIAPAPEDGSYGVNSTIDQIFIYMNTTFGVIDADVSGGWPFRLTSLIIIFSGIFVMSTLIGILTTAIDSKLEQLRKGRSRVIESGHTVILGWSEVILVLINELVIANENHPDMPVLLLFSLMKTKSKWKLRIREAVGHQQPSDTNRLPERQPYGNAQIWILLALTQQNRLLF